MTIDEFLKPSQDTARIPTFVIDRGVNGWVLSVAGQTAREFWVAHGVEELLSLARSLLTEYASLGSVKRDRDPGDGAISH